MTIPAANGAGANGANGRPVAAAPARGPDADSRPAANGARPTPSADDALRYGDGTAVDPANEAERQAFEQYRQAHNRAPASKAHSRTYYQQQMATAGA